MKLENYPRMLLSALPILLSLIVSSLTFAQGTQVDEVRLSAEMAQLKERLDLTEEQATQGRPIIRASAERSFAIISERGLDSPQDFQRLGMFQKISLGRAMKKIRDETDEGLRRVLSAAQIEEFSKFRDERQNTP